MCRPSVTSYGDQFRCTKLWPTEIPLFHRPGVRWRHCAAHRSPPMEINSDARSWGPLKFVIPPARGKVEALCRPSVTSYGDQLRRGKPIPLRNRRFTQIRFVQPAERVGVATSVHERLKSRHAEHRPAGSIFVACSGLARWAFCPTGVLSLAARPLYRAVSP